MTYRLPFVFLALGWLFATASSAFPAVRVHVSVPPQGYLAERIGGERVRVEAFVPAGESCESFHPRPAHVRALAGAELFFTTGLPYEEALMPRLKALFPDLRIIDTLAGLPLLGAACCPHGGHAGHSHGHGDPHVWMSPALALAQAANMRDALSARDPDGAEAYTRNFERLALEIEGLDAELRGLLAPHAGRPFYVYHPAFGYFADAYGLEQVAIEHNGAEPSPARLARLVGRAREEGVRAVFVQPAESTRSAALLADAVGGRVVVIDPMRADWPDNLREIARAVASSFADGKPGR